jgi:hypothetical protein
MSQDSPPAAGSAIWQHRQDQAHHCSIFQRGRHRDGTFIRVFVPDAARQPGAELRVILYLHGFALCLPSFYEQHMLKLAEQGWIVLYPDYQRSSYREEPLGPAPAAGASAPAALSWGRTTRRLLRRKREDALAEDDLPQEMARASDEAELASALPALQVKDLRRVLLPWLLIQLVLAVIGWFRRSYARNLGQLIGTVLLSLAYAPKHWLANAAVLAEQAWRDLAREPQYQHWPSQPPAVYGFGHSLGGLLSLSLPALPALIGPDAARPWEPQVILACDPATSTEMGIPGFAIALLKLFGSPFTAEPLRIQDTGPCLSQPVVILHGLADTLVPPQQWDPQGSDGAYAAIRSHEKALFFASSNPQHNPPLLAFHNQAVTSTQYYDDDLFRSFGGVKHGANAYNTAWIWPALTALFQDRVPPAELLNNLPCRPPFDVVDAPPPAPRQRWRWWLVLALTVVAALVWWLARGMAFTASA